MKKNFSVNISGRLFHIDEDAYELLEKYFSYLEKSFENEPERQEIIDDFQKRISDDLWNISKSDHKHIIELNHVHKVLADLGYFSEEAQEEERFKRSGVKRLFRHPDDRFIGGVCGGIAKYFNVDPLIVRILFIVFAFIFASGILVYIVMWIVVPLATSPIDRLNMSGDEITLDKIKEILKTEFSEVEKRFRDLKKKVVPENKQQDIEDDIRDFISASLFFRVFTGSILIAVSLFMIIGLIILLFNPLYIGSFFGVEISSFSQIGSLLFDSAFMGTVVKWSLFLMFMIPFSGVLFFGMSILSGITVRSAMIRWVSRYLGTISLLVFLFSVVYLYLQFLFVDKKETVYMYAEGYYSEMKLEVMDVEHPSNLMLSGVPELSILPGGDDSLRAVVLKRSYGRTSVQAAENNENLHFNILSSGDTLFFSPFWVTENTLWRGQNVKVLIEIPIRKRFRMSHQFVSHFLPGMTHTDSGKKRYRYRMLDTGPVKL